MNEQIRASFPAALNSTYLNTAAMAPIPTAAVEATTDELAEVAANGACGISDRLATRERVRSTIASMLGVRADEIAFTRNTSDGLCAVAAGIDWREGDNIVSCENEFPANYYPWRKVSDEDGVELRLVPERSQGLDVDELCSLIDGRTRLVTVSAVQYASGFKLDLERIGRAARKNDALFCVDMIQAFGAVPLDLPAQFVDVAAGASYKWLCGGPGVGILYVGDRARDRVRPASRSWMGVADPWNFDEREQDAVDDARKFETGLGASALFAGLEQSLKLLCEAGVDRIAGYLDELTEFLCEIVPGDRYSISSSRAKGERSQIVSLEPLRTDSNNAARHLADEGIHVSSRSGRLRIAPHFFNSEGDVERLAACLP